MYLPVPTFYRKRDEGLEQSDTVVKRSYKTSIVQHCHIENPISFAYMEKGRIVVVTSTQIPHIVRRVIGQALGIPWGRVRVIKPYIGGGFGNKQDVLYEPLNAFLTTQVGGRPVKLEVSREETFCNTRTRHSIEYDLTAGVDKEGHLLAKDMKHIPARGLMHPMVTPLPPTVLLHGDFSMPAQIPEARLIPFIPIPLQPEPCVPTAFLRQPLPLNV